MTLAQFHSKIQVPNQVTKVLQYNSLNKLQTAISG